MNCRKYLCCYSYVFCAILMLMISASITSQAQTAILQRPIYLDLKNIRADKALEIISRQCDFNFTYNTSLFRPDSVINVISQGGNVKQLLDKIFKNKFDYKVKGKNVIITKAIERAEEPKAKKKLSSNYVIQGAITNHTTGENIAFASVYDTASLASAVTNVKGFFKLVIESKDQTPHMAIAVSKKDYIDTLIVVEPANEGNISVALSPQPVFEASLAKRDTFIVERTTDETDSEHKKNFTDEKWLQFLSSFKQRIAAINIAKNKDHYAQFSIVPSFGTDGTESALYTYHISLNLFGGYTGGVNGFEAACLFNLNKSDVKGFQAAGLFNTTGGNLEGFQAAALLNSVYGGVQGTQSAGLINICSDSLKGSQLAGLININGGALTGLQAAGLLNLQSGELTGIQLAGFANLAAKQNSNVQYAGFFNVAKNTDVQGVGFINVAKKSTVQMAGFLNVADTSIGFQAAGFMNVSKSFKGLHVGILNIADTCSGLPIGLLSIIRKGLHQIELRANEVTYLNLGYRTGVKKFYTVLSVGVAPSHGQMKFTYGAGIGHSIVLNEKSNINVELYALNVHVNNWEQFNNIYSFRIAYERYLVPKVSVFAGLSANTNVYDSKDNSDNLYPRMAFDHKELSLFTESFNNGYMMASWIGFNAGIRFL